jgi:DNA repair protein RadC
MYRYTLRLVRERASEPYGKQILGPEDASVLVEQLLADEATEVSLVLMLDRRHRLRGYHEVGRGGIAHSPMEPREVLSTALVSGAAAVIVAHNHPSGELSPSADDIAITRRLMRGCDLVGIEFVDHLIVGFDPVNRRVTSVSLLKSGAL